MDLIIKRFHLNEDGPKCSQNLKFYDTLIANVLVTNITLQAHITKKKVLVFASSVYYYNIN